MVLNSQGIDIWAALREAGIGGNPAQVLATGDRIVSLWQQALPIVTGIWAYLERRAPHYRLVWPWKWGTVGGFLLLVLLLSMPPGAALAVGAQCGQTAAVRDLLRTKYGEHPLGVGAADNAAIELWIKTETGTWTAMATDAAGTSCLISSGQRWVTFDAVAEGDPT
jgi:hypothetical protein